MQAVMLEVPEALLAERRRLGHDRFDEMWEGVLHMVPPPRFDHQDLSAWLVSTWRPLARAHGLWVTQDTGLFDPKVPDFSSYRQPDVAVTGREHLSDRGIEGRTELAVEIRSPGDESYEKLPFYDRVGVQEFLVIELDLTMRHWARREELLRDVTVGDGTSVTLEALPVTLSRTEQGALAMDGDFGTTTFEGRNP
jgi:Uma2 family endonuclease